MNEHSSSGPEPIRAQAVAETISGPVRVILEQPRGRLGWLSRRLLWIMLGLSLLANLSLFSAYQSYFQSGTDIHEKYHSLSRGGKDKIAVITIDGLITGGSDTFAKRQIDRVRVDEDVKAIVLRVDSPGGTVTGSDYLYHHLKKLAKDKQVPLVVSMGSIAASGGYYISMAAGDHKKVIFAEPTTWTGSIGVIIPHYDLSGLLKKFDVTDDSIASHPLKQMGSPTAMLPPEEREKERAILKELVDDSFKGFRSLVLENRGPLREKADSQEAVFTGRIFTASEAQQHGLVDELGFVEDAIDRAIELANLDKKNVRVIKYARPFGILDQVLLGSESRSRQLDLSALLDLSAPRAYYLCTLLPTISAP